MGSAFRQTRRSCSSASRCLCRLSRLHRQQIGRVIQAVEDMGRLNDTLIIYISGDNGSSAEGSPNGTPNEVAQFNGVEVPVEAQLKLFYDAWGSDKTITTWRWDGPGLDTPYKWTKQVASTLWRHAARHVASPGPATSTTWAAFAISSIIITMSCPPSSKPPMSSSPTWWMGSSSGPSKA